MNGLAVDRLGKPKPMRFRGKQWGALGYLAEFNNDVSINHVARVFVDMGIKVTRLNGGVIPLVDQIRLQRALAHRAYRHATKKKK